VEEDFSPELLLAISAAVAAYLGERAHVRAVRLVGTTRWSQEGRAFIQASHRLQRS
jgi:methylmalonyl-CoA carboxyltransferase large subunit